MLLSRAEISLQCVRRNTVTTDILLSLGQKPLVPLLLCGIQPALP